MHQVVRRDVFEEIAVRAGVDGGKDLVFLAEAGQDEDAGVGTGGNDLGAAAMPSIAGITRSRNNHVGLEAAGQLHGLGAVSRFADDLDGQRGRRILQLQESTQPLAHHRVVVHDEHPNLLCVVRTGHPETGRSFGRADPHQPRDASFARQP